MTYVPSARVDYVVGTQFALPPRAHAVLLDACNLYAAALEHAPLAQDEVPSASRLDVLSNGGYALHALAELVDECGTYGLDTACTLAAQRAGVEQLPLPVALYAAAALWFDQVAQGQGLVLHQSLAAATAATVSGGASSTESVPAAPPTSSSLGNEDQQDSVFTTSLVAPASLLESLYDQINSKLALIPHTQDPTSLDQMTNDVGHLLSRAETFVQSMPPGYGAMQSPTGAWDEQMHALDMAALSLQIMTIEQATEWNAWPSSQALQAIEDAVMERASSILASAPPAQSLTAVRLGAEAESRIQQYEADVSRLCDLGDNAHVLARVRVQLASCSDDEASSMCSSSSSSAERAWLLATCAAKCMRAAAAALETPNPPIGRSTRLSTGWASRDAARGLVSNTSTSITRHRASMYTELSRISLTRCHETLVALYPPASEARRQLLDHARIYARRALVDDGLAWMCQTTDGPTNRGQVSIAAQTHTPPDGGWESLSQDTGILLQYVRALWKRSIALPSAQADRELHMALISIWSLTQVSEAYRAMICEPVRILHVLEDLAFLDDSERTFWDSIWRNIIMSPDYDPIDHPWTIDAASSNTAAF